MYIVLSSQQKSEVEANQRDTRDRGVICGANKMIADLLANGPPEAWSKWTLSRALTYDTNL